MGICQGPQSVPKSLGTLVLEAMYSALYYTPACVKIYFQALETCALGKEALHKTFENIENNSTDVCLEI